MIYLIAIGSNTNSRFGSPINNLKNTIKFLETRNIQVLKKLRISQFDINIQKINYN